ncbi:hypothetical protein RRG08_020453 [Elysia crispata]|uniref:Uncharacterized protein n=1 Tax=Elysia crispata TaxID=231223 RepID=A0AAE1B4W3_9GAST|nr:hypothetical protein RRG08_020453 [Elysia crispata]
MFHIAYPLQSIIKHSPAFRPLKGNLQLRYGGKSQISLQALYHAATLLTLLMAFDLHPCHRARGRVHKVKPNLNTRRIAPGVELNGINTLGDCSFSRPF